jgi:cytochrome P450
MSTPPLVPHGGWCTNALWLRRPLELLEEGRPLDPHVFALRFGGFGTVALAHSPEAIRTLLSQPAEQVSAAEAFSQAGQLLGPNALFRLEGEPHRRHRRLLLPAFHGRRLATWAHQMQAATRRAAAAWPSDTPASAYVIAERLTLEIILEVVFGIAEHELDRARALLTRLMHAVGPAVTFFPFLQRDLGPGSPGRRFQRARAAVDALIDEQVRARRHGPTRDDVLHVLIHTPTDDTPLSDAEVRDELTTLLAAGHETTAAGLCWALHHVLQHPEVLARLREELATLGPALDPVAMARLPWLAATCDEALRLVPVIAANFRAVRADLRLGAHTVPAGWYASAAIHLAHHNPAVFPEPLQFRPERFLDRTYPPESYLPFGMGARRCIGAVFAAHELRIALGTLLAEHELEHLGPATGVARRNLVLVPSGGPRLRRRDRR